MLVPLLPEQVSQNWRTIAPLILDTLPAGLGITPIVPANILRAILAEEALVWVWYDDREAVEAAEISLVVMTAPRVDNVTGIKDLLIYSLTAVRELNHKRIWIEGLETLEKHARACGCRNICAFTDHEGLVRFLQNEGNGWRSSQWFITKPV